jgi:V8-like Glu-specific endopeptidase
MNVLDAIRQTTRRAGSGHTRRRHTEVFERITKNWHAVEKPERVLCRMEQLGLHQEVLKLASSMVSGEALDGLNPLERIIGQSQLMSSFFLPLGAERTRAVGRIVTKNDVGFGTGFLVSPRLLMTNNHVLEDAEAAAHSRVEFDFVRRFDGHIGTTQLFRLLPAEFFITSVAADDLNLDYTIVAVEAVNSQGARLAERGFIPLIATSGKLALKELANIIQHPGGEPQQVALRDSQVVESLEDFIRYEADTLPGSSGSPVFNDQWQLAALHHSGIPEEVRPGVYRLRDGGEWDTRLPLSHSKQLQLSARINWVSNEGVRISSIAADVRARLRGDASRLAFFEEAVGQQELLLSEQIKIGRQDEVRQPSAVAPPVPQVVTQTAQGSMTWIIPLRVTVQLGSELYFSPPAGPALPDSLSSPERPAPNNGPPSRPPHVKSESATAEAAVARARQLLDGRPEVLEARDGFLWQDGLMTERRAVVVVLDPSVPVATGDPFESLCIPREIDGLPVDLTLGGPAAVLRAARRRGRLVAEALPLADLFEERVPPIAYIEPEGLSLDEVIEPMEVICHVSPDDGWPVLSDFLTRVKKTLTVGIFDLSAPHIVRKLSELAEANPDFHLNLSIQRGLAGGLTVGKENELNESDVVESLRQSMGDRFRQAYVDVSGKDRTFASSYHIKVAVRDGQELWLSSGNMQSSNQPPPHVHPAHDDEQTFGPLRHYNREWHVIVKNKALAQTFEAYLLHDLRTAEAHPAEPGPPAHELFVHAELRATETAFSEEAARPRYFPRKVIPKNADAPVTVQPLLTPDNYLGHVIQLVRSAQSRLFIQNQALTLLDPLENNERAFIELWQAIESRQHAGVDVRMIFRVRFDEDEARAIKDRLVKFGFKPECIRVQKGCHTKGVIVDSKVLLIGSHNWTNQGATANRDASLIFRHPEIARYYEQIFLFDWERLARDPKPTSLNSISRGSAEERIDPAWRSRPQLADTVRLSLREMIDD